MAKCIKRRFPANPNDYQMYEKVGEGVITSVYKALCIPLNEIVAIKVLDLEKCDNDLDGIICEVRAMTLTVHPNLLHAYCSFTSDHFLWVVMPYMAAGSCSQIMKYAYQTGFQKLAVATILHEVLKSLIYLHSNGLTHRAIKAENILLDANGGIKLADFGVSACMFDTGNKKHLHSNSVGMPYWIAPEILQQLHGYDHKSDIWSFGTTALELAHGHDAFSNYKPTKNASPGLGYKKDKRFSKSFKKLVAACLAMDPKKRPTSKKLLKHSFFRHSRSNEYLMQTILKGLAPIDERFRILKGKDANVLKQNKAVFGDKKQLPQQDHIHGISAWNFNLEDTKDQAALISLSCGEIKSDDVDNNHEPTKSTDSVDPSTQSLNPEKISQPNASNSSEDEPHVRQNLEVPSASILFSVQSLEVHRYSSGQLHTYTAEDDGRGDMHKEYQYQHKRNPSGPLLPSHPDVQISVSGSMREELSAGRVIQHKGRFKITSEEGNKVAPSDNRTLNAVIGTSSNSPKNAVIALPMLQLLMQQNIMQKETLANLIKLLEQGHDKRAEHSTVNCAELSQTFTVLSMEKELQQQVNFLEQCVISTEIEVQKLKSKNAKLEYQINAKSFKLGEITEEDDGAKVNKE